jgi:murein DD-endopeptidase MepM/ murein hydrolase activator NlpD
MHEGLDFVAPVGTPVLATAAGEVVKAEFSGAFGHLVELTHADGFSTRYAHLNSILVKPGERVALHGVVGTLGNTGRSTGPHLHYEVMRFDRVLNPTQMLPQTSVSSQ